MAFTYRAGAIVLDSAVLDRLGPDADIELLDFYLAQPGMDVDSRVARRGLTARVDAATATRRTSPEAHRRLADAIERATGAAVRLLYVNAWTWRAVADDDRDWTELFDELRLNATSATVQFRGRRLRLELDEAHALQIAAAERRRLELPEVVPGREREGAWRVVERLEHKLDVAFDGAVSLAVERPGTVATVELVVRLMLPPPFELPAALVDAVAEDDHDRRVLAALQRRPGVATTAAVLDALTESRVSARRLGDMGRRLERESRYEYRIIRHTAGRASAWELMRDDPAEGARCGELRVNTRMHTVRWRTTPRRDRHGRAGVRSAAELGTTPRRPSMALPGPRWIRRCDCSRPRGASRPQDLHHTTRGF